MFRFGGSRVKILFLVLLVAGSKVESGAPIAWVLLSVPQGIEQDPVIHVPIRRNGTLAEVKSRSIYEESSRSRGIRF